MRSDDTERLFPSLDALASAAYWAAGVQPRTTHVGQASHGGRTPGFHVSRQWSEENPLLVPRSDQRPSALVTWGGQATIGSSCPHIKREGFPLARLTDPIPTTMSSNAEVQRIFNDALVKPTEDLIYVPTKEEEEETRCFIIQSKR